MRLVRSNDDPKLLADLERLAAGEAQAPPPTPEGKAPAAAVPSGAAAAVAAIDDSFVRRFVRTAVHVRRYAPFYAGGGLWLAALVLIQPVGKADGTTTGFAQPAGLGRAGAVTPAGTAAGTVAQVDDSAAPIFDSFGGSTFAGASFGGAADFSTTSAFDEPSTTSESSGSDDTDFDSFETFEDEDDDAPTPLTIGASGYASSTGGTPLEAQPADGGLPVTVTGGTTVKYSFFRLSGDEPTLRLRETADSVNHEAAPVRLCPLASGSWEPGPGQAMAEAPQVEEGALCATGTRDGEGVWSFELSDFGPLADSNGFALVQGAGTGSTFQVVFEPMAVASPVDAEA